MGYTLYFMVEALGYVNIVYFIAEASDYVKEVVEGSEWGTLYLVAEAQRYVI